jgi:hypothetical protein
MTRPIAAFTRSEVAKLIGVDIALIKNWSSGHPYRIGPSILNHKRVGHQVFYSLDDLYSFALIKYLNAYGINYTYVQQILKLALADWHGRINFEMPHGALVIKLSDIVRDIYPRALKVLHAD